MLFRNLAIFVSSLSDDEFGECLRSFGYFQSRNKELAEEYKRYEIEEHISKKDRQFHFSSLLREIRHWKDMDLDYMYSRVMRLSNELGGGMVYFKEKSFGGVTIPDRTTILNKLNFLAKKLLYQIYPSIELQLTHFTDTSKIESYNIQGKIDWHQTIINAVSTSGGNPITFTCLTQKLRFDTPENLLLLTSILWLQNDAKKLMNFQKIEKFSSREKRLLREIILSTETILNHTPLREIISKSKLLSEVGRKELQIRNLQKKIQDRLQFNVIRQTGYEQLSVWIKEYLNFNFQRYKFLTNFSMDRLEKVDTMFELWILFEFVTYLHNFKGLRFEPFLTPKRWFKHEEIGGFNVLSQNKKFFLKYDQEYKAQTTDTLRPDFTIEQENGNTPIVMDAKNWRQNKRETINKMIVYLAELNLLNPTTGILFFSNYEGLPENKPFQIKELTIENKKWTILMCVLKPSRGLMYEDQRQKVFEQIFEIMDKRYKLV